MIYWKHIRQRQKNSVEKYAISHYFCSNAIVNVQDVAGTDHQDYAGNSWLWLLQNGEKMNDNLQRLASYPLYYTEDKRITPIRMDRITPTPISLPMEFRKVDNKLYIYGDGNHRSCIARFYLYYLGLYHLRGVCLHEYTVDREFQNAHKRLDELFFQQGIPCRTELVCETLRRNDTAGWMREEYSLKLRLVTQNGGNMLLDINDIKALIEDSQRPFKRWFGKHKRIWNGQ